MASAFTLTLAYLGEHCSAADAGGAFAAYITGNVASNLVGRLVSAAVADHFGLASNFYFFAALNLAGALLVYFTITARRRWPRRAPRPLAARGLARALAQPAAARGLRHRLLHPLRLHRHVHLRELRAGARAALARPHGDRLCLLRVPSVHHDDADGGPRRRALRDPTGDVGVARARRRGAPSPSRLQPHARARRPGADRGRHLLRAGDRDRIRRPGPRRADRGAASGIYLASYFFGGLVGSAVLGQLFDRVGWAACVAGIGLSLALAALLAGKLTPATAGRASAAR